MTRDEAKKLKIGDYIASARFAKPYEPRRVTAVWHSSTNELHRITTGDSKGPWWWTEDLIKAPGPSTQWKYVDGGWERIGSDTVPKSVRRPSTPSSFRQEK